MKLKHKILAVLLAMGAIAACGTPITLLYLQNLAQLESLALETASSGRWTGPAPDQSWPGAASPTLIAL